MADRFPDEQPPWERGYTAMEVAEALVTDSDEWRRRETIRRRVQELQDRYRMLDVIGIRQGARSHKDNQVYVANDLALQALRAWEEGRRWKTEHLVRHDDPSTSRSAVREMNPDTDFHRVILFFVRNGASR